MLICVLNYLIEAILVDIPVAKSIDVSGLHIIYIYFAAINTEKYLVLCK